MIGDICIFTFSYLCFTLFIIHPPVEFISSGITITTLLSSFLGSEHNNFVLYHIKRTNIFLLIYSFLPFGYILGLWIFDYTDEISIWFDYDQSWLWQIFSNLCIMLPILAVLRTIAWSLENWEEHPIAVNISKFCNNNSSWLSVASDIEAEFRSNNKITINTHATCKIVATENWIIKVTSLSLFFAHKSGAILEVVESDTHRISEDVLERVQFLNIEVKSQRENIQSFAIRINSNDFIDLQEYVARPIVVLPNIKFNKNLMDVFIDVFKEVTMENPRYVTNEELEVCMGCMQTISNVKLQKMCVDSENVEKCIACYCRPMWCIDCMARWFASKQDSKQSNTWLSSKSTCPMCRATFCTLDVCLVED